MKIAQPYRCDGPGCKKLREDDTNHWWLVGAHNLGGGWFVQIETWNDKRAEQLLSHACGIDCATKVAAAAMAKIIDGGKPNA